MLSTVVSHVRRERAVLSLALAIAVFLVAAPAHAAPTKVSWPVFINVAAAPHTHNDVRMFYQLVKDPEGGSWWHGVFDTAGITTRVTDPPTCYPYARVFPGNSGLQGKAVMCPDGSAVGAFPPGQGEDFHIFLGDEADRFSAEESIGSFKVHSGSGNDTVYGNNAPTLVVDFDSGAACGYVTEDELYGDRGNDRLYGRWGPDLLSGGPGNDYLRGGQRPGSARIPGSGYCIGFRGRRDDTLRGGSGNDVLRADDGDRDLSIDCGPGRDRAFLDRQDPKPRHCETVKRH